MEKSLALTLEFYLTLTLLNVSLKGASLDDFVQLAISLFILALALTNIQIAYHAYSILLYVLFVFIGVYLRWVITFIISVSSFWVVRVYAFQGLLRDFAVGLRKPATDDHDGITQARPLGDLLASQKLRENLGGNLIAFLKVLLADQAAGFNARHNVAHGLVGASWFDKTIADLLLVTIIQLASFRPDVSYAPQP